MTAALRPRLRPLEVFPVGREQDMLFAFRDPEGFSRTVALKHPAALLATLCDGRHTLSEVQADFANQLGQQVPLIDLERFLSELDQALMLDTPRFRAHRQAVYDEYLNKPVRPASHAGGAYASDPVELSKQLAELFTCKEGPGAPRFDAVVEDPMRLRGILSPHIDLHRGGPAFAWAYKQLVELSQADVFVIFGTAHNPMRNLFSVSRKDFATPLGTVRTNQDFVDRLAMHLAAQAANVDSAVRIFDDELTHRQEHSIEFQALFLQYLLADRREFTIVPVLTGSFHRFVTDYSMPKDDRQVASFTKAMQAAEAEFRGRVLYISGGDLAHIGQRFGDRDRLDRLRLEAQSHDDRELLAAACLGDAGAFFKHVALQQDRNRICGLSPTYTLMECARPRSGELLKYSQAVEDDGSSCVSFASLAFYAE